MSLFAATLLTALALVVVGILLIWNGAPVAAYARSFPRSRRAAYFTMGASTLWTLYRVTQLGEADFGNYSNLILAAFLALAVLAFVYVPDFLSVRGACILCLLIADLLLRAAFMQYDQPARLFLVGFVYAAILLALYLAVSPFRLRDFFNWLFAHPFRTRLVGGIALGYGLVLGVAAASY
ncbi:MAG: hypothetical protein EA425_13675 [Puniceicoccaceae bacterium]|nr:MAG: hypothetical protein EA425_13675 [Puniceicoccaceae bacterium]